MSLRLMTAISIHALQTECDTGFAVHHDLQPISIHALQTECDKSISSFAISTIFISIHALQTECDRARYQPAGSVKYFYPRTPNGVRLGFTSAIGDLTPRISIHALQTECDSLCIKAYCQFVISIHALQTECDCGHFPRYFSIVISIHALQTECDLQTSLMSFQLLFLSTHSKRSATWRRL